MIRTVLDRARALAPAMASDMRAVRRRVYVVGALLVLGLSVLAKRASQVAVIEHPWYSERAHRQQLRNYVLRAGRGDIVDRHHMALAVNDQRYKVVVDPRRIRAHEAGARVLKALQDAQPNESLSYLEKELGQDKAYRRLRAFVDDSAARVLEKLDLPGVQLERVPDRVYPRGLLAAHLLGRVNANGRGNLGIEQGLDDRLSGREAISRAYYAGGKRLLVDGHPDPGTSRGHDVVLTLDSTIQGFVEDSIDALVEEWQPVGASVVVLDPNTGDILALSNRPTFDPNHRVPSLDQTVNLAVQSAYEPGSTLKAITVAAALEEGSIRPEQTFYCESGKWQYTPEHAIKDTKASEILSVTDILAVSSNICTTKIYETLGKESLYHWVRRFGFGERPEVELPGATAGLLAPWQKWSDIQAANISFGQGLSASPLQVAAAFATLANGGVYRPARIVREVRNLQGEVVYAPEHKAERVVREGTARTVIHMLEAVVQSKRGTGKKARIPGYTVAGKTSTAQKASKDGGYDEKRYYSAFVGAVPASAPRLVVLVAVDSPVGRYYGNDVAAPTFATVAGQALQYLGVPREDADAPADLTADSRERRAAKAALEGAEPNLPGQRREVRRSLVPDFVGLTLTQAYDLADRAGIKLTAKGTGVAVLQNVEPLSEVRPERMIVHFEPPR